MTGASHQVQQELFAPNLDEIVERALDARLAEAFRLGAISTPVSAISTGLVLYATEGWQAWLGVWLAVLHLGALLQWVTHRRFADTEKRSGWRRLAVLAQLTTGVGWGLTALVLMPTNQATQSLMLAGLLGILASSIPFAAPVRQAALAFLVPLGSIASIGFAINTTGLMRYSGVIMALSTIFYTLLGLTVHRAFREAAVLTAELEHRANTDPLTGARNRRSFARELQSQLESGADITVAFLDLDGFKAVNDGFGHDIGDELLVRVAGRLAVAASAERVARIGGDEFIVLSEDGEDPRAFGERILSQFGDAFDLQETTVRLGCSVGVATPSVLGDRHEREDGAAALVKAADIAQMEGKQQGGSKVVVAT